LAIISPAAYAAPQDVDFDFILRAVDDILVELTGGQFGTLSNQDRDGNGLIENDQLAMLSAILLGNNPQIPVSLQNQIQIGFELNKQKVARDLILDINVAGVINERVNVLELLADEDPLFPYAVQNMLAGIMTSGDNSTISFLNNFLKSLVVFFVEREGYGFALNLINLNDYINFQATGYNNYGNGGFGGNYLGAGGNIDAHLNGTSNLAEYNASGGLLKREEWLTRCNVTPPLHIIQDPIGGSAQTGDEFTMSVVVAGGSGTKKFQWLRTDSNGKEFPTAYDLVGPNSEVYRIAYVSVPDRARFSVAVSDSVSVYNPATRIGGRQSWGARLAVTQVPLQIVSQPVGDFVNIGDTFSLLFKVRGGYDVPTYGWTRDGAQLSVNAERIDLSPVSGSSGGTYRCVAISGGEVVTSNNAVVTVIGAGEVVNFPDPALRKLVADTLGFGPGKDIYEGDLFPISALTGHAVGIIDLTGLEKLTNLEFLDLWGNEIGDIAPLSELFKLRVVNLGRNQVSNLAPLSELIALESLYLWENQISDVSPLLLNEGIGLADDISLEANPLNEAALCELLPLLEARGAWVYFDGACIIPQEGEVLEEGEILFEGEGEVEGGAEGEMEGEGEEVREVICETGVEFPAIGCATLVESGDAPKPIEVLYDFTSAVCVDFDGVVEDLNVEVDITHPTANALALLLIAPSGFQSFLMSKPPRAGANLHGTAFNDEANRSINNGAPPYAGTYAPVTPLRAFDGESTAGKWQLRVINTSLSAAGTLNAWRLVFNTCTPEVFEEEGELEGFFEGEIEGEEVEGELPPVLYSSGDTDQDYVISLTELLRVVQLFNAITYHCEDGTEDGYDPGPGSRFCMPHTVDYAPQDWVISFSELLRFIQFYNSEGSRYHYDPNGEDGFAAGAPPA